MRLDSRGISVIEIIVASGLMLTLGLAMSTMMNNSSKTQRSLALTNDYQNVSSAVAQVLNNETSCSAMLQERVVNLLPSHFSPTNPKELGEISYTSGGTTLSVAKTTTAPQNGLWIKSIAFDRVIADLGTATGAHVFIANLKMEAYRRGGQPTASGGVGSFTDAPLFKDFAVTVVSNPASGAILKCYQDPRITDICVGLGGTPNADGTQCSIAPELCRLMNGNWSAGPPPSCDFSSGPGTFDPTERVCIDLGGEYNSGGNPKCSFLNNPPGGATSLEAMCKSTGGLLIPGPPPKCDNCTPNGGVLDTLGKCDYQAKPCQANGGQYTAGASPGTGICDMRAKNCIDAGNTWDGAACRVRLRQDNCIFVTGGTSRIDRNDSFTAVTPMPQCPAGKYLADFGTWFQSDADNDDQAFTITFKCCDP